MQRMRRAIIDVGTNSVKLLVADVEGLQVHPLLEKSEQTRLGQGFYETHQLQGEAIAHTARVVAGFARSALELETSTIRVIGTSAARDAVNQGALASAVEQAAGLPLEIISGDQEAEWVFRGIATDPRLNAQRQLIMDVGGGSTELILGEGGHHLFRQSFPLGTLRLLEKWRLGDPPRSEDLAECRLWLDGFFQTRILPSSEAFLQGAQPGTQLVGTGGTATILARMEGQMTDFDREAIEAIRLTRQRIAEWMTRLWSLPLAERRNIIGLPPNRADVILMGVAIYDALMAHAHFSELYISTRGLRFGAIINEP